MPAAAGQLYNPSEVFPGSSNTTNSSSTNNSSSRSSRHRATAAAVSEAAATLHVLQAAAWRQCGCSTLAAVHALTAVLCYSSSEGLLVGGGAASSSCSGDRQLALAQLVTLVAEQQGVGGRGGGAVCGGEGRGGGGGRLHPPGNMQARGRPPAVNCQAWRLAKQQVCTPTSTATQTLLDSMYTCR